MGNMVTGILLFLAFSQNSLRLQFNAKEAAAIKNNQVKFQDAQVRSDLQTIHDY